MDHSDYIAKMMEILDDTSKFECLGMCEDVDNTGLNERALQAFLLRQFKSKKISEEVYERIWPTGSEGLECMAYPKCTSQHPSRCDLFCL